MVRPLVRYAISRKRCASVSKLYSSVVKMLRSAMKVTVVPLGSVVSPTRFTGSSGTPSMYSWTYRLPSLRTSARSHSLSALTTLAPTPCRPEETL